MCYISWQLHYEETGEITFIRIDRINMLTNTKSQALIDLSPEFNILSCLLHLRKKIKYHLTFILLEEKIQFYGEFTILYFKPLEANK